MSGRPDNSNPNPYAYDVNEFKDVPEELIHFKESKYNLSLKTENSLIQKIYIHNLIFILYYYFKFDIDNPLLKSKYKINNKTGIKIFSENIIYLLIYNKITNK